MILICQVTGAHIFSDYHSFCFFASPFPFSLYGITPVLMGIFSLLLLVLCGFFGYQSIFLYSCFSSCKKVIFPVKGCF